MRNVAVKELMTPLDRYTTIAQDASLKDAFLLLEGAFRGEAKSDAAHPRDFAVLVVDQNRQVIGRLVVWDVLRALEPQRVSRVDSLSMVDDYGVWSQPLINLATKARYIQVKNIVQRLHGDEFINADASLDKAVHRLIAHRFLSLIVTERGRTAGVLRVVDVFSHICAIVREA